MDNFSLNQGLKLKKVSRQNFISLTPELSIALVPPYLSIYAVHIVVMLILCNEILDNHETKCVVGFDLNEVWISGSKS